MDFFRQLQQLRLFQPHRQSEASKNDNPPSQGSQNAEDIQGILSKLSLDAEYKPAPSATPASSASLSPLFTSPSGAAPKSSPVQETESKSEVLSQSTEERSRSVKERLSFVRDSVVKLCERLGRPPPVLVAVSKFQPIEAIMEAYRAGQRHFGENFVQELVMKAPLLPPDIQWHMIGLSMFSINQLVPDGACAGHVQSNKANALASIPNLVCIESVDSVGLATKLDAAIARRHASAPSGQSASRSPQPQASQSLPTADSESLKSVTPAAVPAAAASTAPVATERTGPIPAPTEPTASTAVPNTSTVVNTEEANTQRLDVFVQVNTSQEESLQSCKMTLGVSTRYSEIWR